MPSFDKLQASYQRLAKGEQLVLRVLSVLYEPANQTLLNQILADVYRGNEQYRLLDINVNKQMKYKFEARSLVEITASKLRCHDYIVEWLTLQAVINGEFELFLKVALHHAPLIDTGRHYMYNFSPYQEKRGLRYALHCGQYQRVFELLDISNPYGKPSAEKAKMLDDICANPLHGEWFATMPEAIQYQILRPFLDSSIVNWSDSRIFYMLLKDIGGNVADVHPAVRELIAEQRLYRGEWQSLQPYLDEIGSHRAETLKACLLFLQGKSEDAVATFQSAIARVRKETRKRNIVIDELPGVIYLLALLTDQAPENISAAKKQFTLVEKQKHADAYYNEMLLLNHVRAINDGKRQFDSEYFKINFRFYTPFTTLIVALSLFWNNHKVDDSVTSNLKKIRSKAKDSGYQWFAHECQQLLAAFAGVEYKADAQWGPPLTQVVPKLQDWERSLKALINVPAGTAPKAKKPASSSQQTRIAWLIHEDEYGALSLKPKERKQKVKGGWTTGRAIALKRLSEDTESFAYLTEADRKICRFIHHSRSYDYYGYSKYTYTLNGINALLAAEGHPHLYKSEAPTVAVDITTGMAELLVIEQGNEIRLTLEPYPEDSKHLIVNETHERIRIYQYSDELLHIAQILGDEGLLVPKTARSKVLESVSAIAPLLTIHSDVDGISNHQAETVDADPRLYVHLQHLDDGLRVSFHVKPFGKGPILNPGHGGESLFAEIDGKQLQTKRNLDLEKEQFEAVVAACHNLYEFAANDWRWDEIEDALEGLLALQELGDQVVLGWPEGREIKLSRSVGLSDMSVSLRQKTEWFEMDGELNVSANEVYSMQVLLELISADSGRFIQMADGQFLTLTAELRKRLEELQHYNDKGRVHSLNAINLEESIDGMNVDADEAWGKFKQRLQTARDLQPELPSTLQADLRDYQVLGFNWLCRLSEWGAGACLADDMGLGKTLQALALIVNRAAEGATLILAPTSVCTNWIEEALRFSPTLNPIRFGTTGSGTKSREKTLQELKPYDLLVCSYGLLQSEAESLQAIHWHTIVADEAQAFKNAATKRSRAVMKLNGDFKMIATGTPIENHLGELWNLFQFINPGLLGSRQLFNEKFAYPIENQNDATSAGALRRLISPFILRRLKRDVLTELPPRTEITLRVDLSKEETSLYEALRLEAVSRLKDDDSKPGQQHIKALASIMKLRRVVCNPNMVIPDANLPSAKLEVFDGLLEELLENKHKALVFSQFVDHLSLIRAHLDEKGISYQYLDGSTSTKKRTRAINAFQAGEGDLFLISLKAGGVGLNLTAADYVIHMDPWWNPAVEDQASDRAHRIGQQRPVTVYRIVANNTIEEKIVDLHAEKRGLADRLLEGSEVSAKMSLDDMLQLLEH